MGESNLFREKLKSIKLALTLSVFSVGLYLISCQAQLTVNKKPNASHSYRKLKELVFNTGGYDF